MSTRIERGFLCMYASVVLLVIFAFLIAFAPLAYAGFGITPPYVRNSSLTRNSIYEQKILLVRSDPSTALRAQVLVDVPEMTEWITIVEGTEFIMPAGEQKVPMTVRVQVPDDAEFKKYLGNIRVKTSAADGVGGGVNISLGAQIDVEIEVIDKVIEDFRVRKIGLPDLNEGHKFWWLYFPGKMNFEMTLENTGNVDVAPSKVQFRLYDTTGQILLEETTHTNRIKKIKPFQTESVVAELPTRLPRGVYLGKYQIYNQQDVKQEGELTVSILPYGTLQAAGYGFMGLSLAHKLSVLLPIFTLCVMVIVGLLRFNRGRTKVARSRARTS